MSEEREASERQKRSQMDEVTQFALLPVLCGGGVYGLFEAVGSLTGTKIDQSVAVAGFTTVLASLVMNAFKEAVYRKEEQARWKEQRDLLEAIRDRLGK